MKTTISTVLALLSLASALRAAPVVIDDFSDDLATVTSSTLHDGSMTGGEVEIHFTGISGSYAVSGGEGVIGGVSGSGSLGLAYDGDDDDLNSNNYSLLDVDLTDGGSNNALAIDLTSVTGSVDITVAIADSDTDYSYGIANGVTDPGVVEIPFGDVTVQVPRT